jgi:DNA mismatch endonuclease, patch repair protein
MLRPKRALTPSYTGFRPASEAASRAKRANKRKDTVHEVLLRREVWRLGLRYRKNVNNLPGKPDLVFGPARVVVFCDGDFWHGRDWVRLKKQLQRRHNAKYWLAKIASNIVRDRLNVTRLRQAGWYVIRFWESEIMRYPGRMASAVRMCLTSPMSD